MTQETKTTRAGCLLVHGYGGSPFEMEGVASALENAGMRTRLVCLPGHGEGHEDFKKYRFPDWLAHAEKEFVAMAEGCGRIVVIGFSMGGAIALNLASRYPVDCIVSLSAPLYVFNLWPWPWENLKFHAHTLVSQTRRLLGPSMLPPAGELSHEIAPWKGFSGPLHFGQFASMREGCAMTRALLPRITAPVLIMHDATDKVVNPENAWAIARRVASTDVTLRLTHIREESTRHHMITTHRETADFTARTVAAFCGEKVLDPLCPA